jgi:Rad3-related DNA helicase
MSQIQKYNKDRKDNIETLDNSNENIVNNISDKKDENNKKNGPEKNKSEINIDNIYKEIKKYINYEYKLNEDIEDTILKKINEFHVNRTNKYNLMIELYNELINQNIDKPSKLSKYIKTNKNLDFINIFNDTKYRRLYNKCERLYKIKDYINIKNLCISKMVDKIFNLKKDQFNKLILKLK